MSGRVDSANTSAGRGRPPLKVMFVCTGNICRSPIGEAVLLQLVTAAGLSDRIEVSSSGVAAHVGWHADDRSQRAAKERGFGAFTDALRGKQFYPEHLADFDYVVAMDAGHEREILRQARKACPQHASKVSLLLRDWAPPEAKAGTEVPDPYYDDFDLFQKVQRLIEVGCEGLLKELQARVAAADKA